MRRQLKRCGRCSNLRPIGDDVVSCDACRRWMKGYRKRRRELLFDLMLCIACKAPCLGTYCTVCRERHRLRMAVARAKVQ